MALTLELPAQQEQTIVNLTRWAEVVADPQVSKFEGRIETDRHGHIIMSPPPAPSHGSFQARIASLLERHLATGTVLTECPISTADGVKAADVPWASPERMRELGNQLCFHTAPEICVEVISPSNAEAEIHEKTLLYFDAGAKEVWLATESGAITFLVPKGARPTQASRICPSFRKRVKLR